MGRGLVSCGASDKGFSELSSLASGAGPNAARPSPCKIVSIKADSAGAPCRGEGCSLGSRCSIGVSGTDGCANAAPSSARWTSLGSPGDPCRGSSAAAASAGLDCGSILRLAFITSPAALGNPESKPGSKLPSGAAPVSLATSGGENGGGEAAPGSRVLGGDGRAVPRDLKKLRPPV